jgi:hypothetical protein
LTSIGNRNANQLTVDVLEENARNLHLGPISPVVVVGHANSAGTFNGGDASGRMPVVEQNSSSITSNTNLTYVYTIKGNPNAALADGTAVTSATGNWIAFAPIQVVQAAGAVPDTPIVNAVSGKTIDMDIYLSFYSAAGGTFTVAIEEDHAGGAAGPTALDPDWGAVTLVLPAGVTTLGPFRMNGQTDNQDIGFDGSACSWPANDDSVTVWGNYRGT